MSLTRRLGLALALGALLPAARAAAVCSVSSACSAAPFIAAPSCCVGNTCTIDRTVTVSGGTCTFNFGTRALIIKSGGKLNVGSSTATINVGRLLIQAPGELNAKGSSSTPGGTVTVNIDTTQSGAAEAFRIEGGSGALMNFDGGGAHAGTLMLFADGPVTFMSGGKITANALGSATPGGTIVIDSTRGPITIDTEFQAQSSGNTGGTTFGGTLRIKCTGPSCDLNVTKAIRLKGEFAGGGALDFDVSGKATFGGGSIVDVSGFNGTGGTGGDVTVLAGAIDALGLVQANGGGPVGTTGFGGAGGLVDLEARTGRLLIQHNTVGVVADGGSIGDGGEVVLVTRGFATAAVPSNGLIDVQAPISLQGASGGGGGGTFDVQSGGGINIQSTINANGLGGGFGEVTLNAIRDVSISNTISSADPQGGGSFSIDEARNVTINGSILMNANTLGIDPGGDGGDILIFGRRDVSIAGGTLDANGSTIFDGGGIEATAGRHLVVQSTATLRANGGGGSEGVGSPGGGGLVFLTAGEPDITGNLTMNGIVQALGPQGTLVGGGTVLLQGCTVAVGGTVDSRGSPISVNEITARQGLTVTGSIFATTSNALITRTGAPPPGGNVNPGFDPVTSRPSCTAPNTPAGCITPCPACGNSSIQFPETCDDGNPNTWGCDACTELCRTVTCSDGLLCNGVETCVFDVCIDPPDVTCGVNERCDPTSGMCVLRECTTAADCSDGDLCNGVEICGAGNKCLPGTPVPCNDNNACDDASCNPQTGVCSHSPISDCQLCTVPGNCDDDQNACTTTACTGGRCVNNPIANCCVTSTDCDDANVCTTDTCEGGPPTGTCAHAGTSGGPCGDECRAGICQSGACVLDDPIVCTPDTDICTNDFCDPQIGCTSEPVEGCCTSSNAECDDQNPCTVDTCDAGLHRCTNEALPVCNLCESDLECDPLGACGQSVCGPGGACIPNTPPNCDDGDPRTQDTCQLDGSGAPQCRSQCINQEACEDGDLCTIDVCDPTESCVSTPVTDFDTVGCRIETIAQLLAAAGDGDVTPQLRTALQGKVQKARTKLDVARSRGLTKRAKKPLNGASKQLKKIKGKTTNGFRKDQILDTLTDAILAACDQGIAAVGTLRQELTAPR